MKKVYQLQNQLVTSFEGRAAAVRRVVTSSKVNIPGIDNETWNKPSERLNAIYELGKITKNPKSYKSKPLKIVMIPKSSLPHLLQKWGPLGIPTLTDRSVQAVYHLAIDPVVECHSDPWSFGFRKERSQHDAISYMRTRLDKSNSPHYVLEMDISKCFDKLSHEFLMKATPICHKDVLLKWLKSGYIYEGKFTETEEGIPPAFWEWGIIYPTLCNIALNGIEPEIRDNPLILKWRNMVDGAPKVSVCRSGYDMIITGKNEEILITAKEIIKQFLAIRSLEFKDAKTRIVHMRSNNGFDFLGYNFSRNRYNPILNNPTNQPTVLIIKPSNKAGDALRIKIKETLIRYSTSIEKIVSELNPVLREWSNYYRISYHSQNTFIKIGHFIWFSMMRWVANKHRNMSIKKAVAKYIVTGKTPSRHKWIWGVNKRDKEKENWEIIKNISETKIKTYSLLKLDRNSYLKENRDYFDSRNKEDIEGKFRKLIYNKYNHICPVCKESLHNGEKIELHHIIPVREGGEYTKTNIQPLHQLCHISITHSKAHQKK